MGCLISNLFGFGVFDIVFGTIATFLSAILTYLIGKKIKNRVLKFIVGGMFPILINALIVPLIFILTGNVTETYFVNFLTIFAGQFVSVYLLGVNLYMALKSLIDKKALKKGLST